MGVFLLLGSKGKKSLSTNDVTFSGHYKRDPLGSSGWASGSASREITNFAYKLQEHEEELQIEEDVPHDPKTNKVTSKRRYQKFTITFTPYIGSPVEKVTFLESVPFNVTRAVGSGLNGGDKRIFSVVVTTEGGNRQWKETYTGSPNATIKREFRAKGMTATYESEKGVYTKSFKKV